MLDQLPRDSQHVGRLPSEDVPILPEEAGDREFLFWVQVGPDVCHLSRVSRIELDRLGKLLLWLEGQGGSLLPGRLQTGWSIQVDCRLLDLLELGCDDLRLGELAALAIAGVRLLDVPTDGDDSLGIWHLEQHVQIVMHGHDLGQAWPANYCMMGGVEIDDLKLKALCSVVVLGAESYRKGNPTEWD